MLSDCIENASQNDAGNYQLTVTDTLTGCSNSTTINLGVLPLPVVDVTPNDPEICFGDSLTINLNGLNSTYLFSPPTGLNTTTGATVIAAPLQTTTYSITILDTLTGCASVDTITLVVHPLPIVDAGPDTISCSGSNLSLAGSPMGGVWSDEQGDNLANGLFNESTPGNYTLYYDYTDANGCHDRDSLEVCVLSNPISSFSVDNLMGCEGAVLQATNTSNTLNDCQSTQYTWSVLFNGAACHTDSMAWSFQSGGANSIDASFLFERSGLYTIILETTNACDTVRTSENIRIGAAPAVMIDSLAILCEQFTVQPSASVSLCNSLQATYSWSFPGADVTSFDGLQAPMLTYSSTGVYTISLTVLTECGESTADYSFEIYDLPSVSASNDGPSCAGGNITLTANAPSAESYEWEGPDGFSSVLPNPVLDNISSLQQGTYSVTVTDANGCENSASTLVAVLPLPDVEIIASTPSICFGDTLSLVAMGDNSYIYTWSPATGLNTTQGNMVFASPDTTTTYFLASLNTLTGCASVDTLTVIVYPLPIVDAGPDAISCSGINLPLAGSPMGGIWSDEEGDNLTNGLFNESTPGNYTLYYDYTDANGCSDRDSLEVCVLSNPISSFSVDNLMGCEGAVIQATNTSNTLNDCQSTQYTWSVLFNGAACHSDSMAWSFQSGGANSIDASFLFEKSGLYTIILETANACDTVRTSENIRIGATPAVLIDSLAVLCEQFTIQPSASVSLCNSLQASYSWSFPGADLTSFDGLQAPMLTYSSTGVYTISLTVQTECGESTADYSFEIYDLPSVSASNDGPSCAGGNIALTANAPTAIAYEWEGPGGFSSVSPNPVLTNISPLQQGNYSVTVTDANGCENSASTLVAVLPLPDVAVIASAPSICLGDTMTLSAISDSLYNYTWSPSTDINTTQGSVVSVYPAVTTTYYLASLNTMTGCSSMDSFRVVVNPLPIVEAGDGYLSCIGEPLSLEGIPAGGIWSDNLGNEIVDGLSTQTMAGVYDVYYEFTTTEGCTEVDSTQICVLEDPLANFDADATMGCFPLTVNCSNTSNTLASCTPADYRWTIRREEDSCDPGSMGWSFISGNTNATNISLLFTSPGIYLVELEVSNLCGSQVFSRTITVGGAPSAELFEFPNQCDNYEINPELVSLLSCNNPLTAIEWSFGPDASIDSWTGEEPPQISFGTTGIKTVEVAVSNECGTSIRTIDFEIFDLPDLTAGSDTTVCLGDTIQLTANSSISNISFEWTGPNNYSAPNSNPIIVNPQLMDAGPYIVEVADLNTGCTNKDTTILMINPLPLVEAGPDESLCAEDSPIQLAGSPAGPNGEWGGAIVNEQGEINPALHLAGTYPITYFYTDDQTLCSAADSLSVTIHPLALEELYQDTLCEDESLIFNGTLYDIDNTTGTEVYTSEVGCDSLRLAVDLGFRVLEMITTIVKPACIGEDNGAIIVESVLGGQAPYTVFLEETAVALTDTFPFQIPRLSAGTYDLMVEDLNGCQVFEDNILVQDPDEIRLNLGEDQTITLGDSVRLIAQLIPPVGSNPTIDWEPNDSSLIIVDNMSATPFAKPFRTRRYTATYTDERGCSVTDDIVITVDRTPNVFIPNVFSPNGDGNNEVFFINAGIDIAEVEVFNIFNRWGANIFEGRNFQPNDPAHGWDGTFKGEELDPAVFVYFAKLRQVDGEIIIFKGDVTLIR
ncbi:MAG: gliding motility-associated C-terminal domain-containing protein [Bacteroidota bacterium]